MTVRRPLVIGEGAYGDGVPQKLQPGEFISGAQSDIDFSAVNSTMGPITVGRPVYVKADGTVGLARANNQALMRVAGLVGASSIAVGEAGLIRFIGPVTSSDWSSVLEDATVTLVPGTAYYLSDATVGKLTSTAPTTAGNAVCYVGLAISTTKLQVSVAPPILL